MRGDILVVTLLAVLLIATTLAGCSTDNSRQETAMEMMKIVPGTWNVYIYLDMKELRDTGDVYERILGGTNSIGIPRDQIERIAMGGSDFPPVFLTQGSFEINGIRNRLDDRFESDEYNGIRIWKNREDSLWITIINGIVIGGVDYEGVIECINVVTGESDSLWDNKTIKEIFYKLPIGVGIRFFKEKSSLIHPPGLEVFGEAATRIDDNSLHVTVIFNFDTHTSADNAINKIWEDLQTVEYWYDLKVDAITQEEDCLKVTAEADVESYFFLPVEVLVPH